MRVREAAVEGEHDIEGVDAAILMHPKVWEASGHVEGFTDPLVECTSCHRRFRADLPEIQDLAGVSTRKYDCVIPEMADTVGVSKSAVSREFIEASERVLKELMERRLDGWDVLVIHLDGIQFGSCHVLAAVGVDEDGKKHVLGLREGASENAAVARALLEDLVERGLDPERRRLFVVDGSKALRKVIDQVFGAENPVQRCRNHKLRNVVAHLPKDQHDLVKAAIRAAWKLEAREGEQKLEQLALWLKREHPSAAASLREPGTGRRAGAPCSRTSSG